MATAAMSATTMSAATAAVPAATIAAAIGADETANLAGPQGQRHPSDRGNSPIAFRNVLDGYQRLLAARRHRRDRRAPACKISHGNSGTRQT